MDARKAILQPVRLSLHQQRFLGDSVRRIGFFGIPVPEVDLAERHGRMFRIGAHGADGDELLHSLEARLLHQLRAHHEILVEELSGPGAVGADAAHDSGQMDHDIRSRLSQEASRRLGHDQVVLRGPGNDEVVPRHAALDKHFHDVRAQETGSAGNQDSGASEVDVPIDHRGPRTKASNPRRNRRGCARASDHAFVAMLSRLFVRSSKSSSLFSRRRSRS